MPQLQFQHPYLLGHTVIAPVLVAKEHGQEQTYENKDAKKPEENKIARDLKPEKSGQGEQPVAEERTDQPDGTNKKPDESVFE